MQIEPRRGVRRTIIRSCPSWLVSPGPWSLMRSALSSKSGPNLNDSIIRKRIPSTSSPRASPTTSVAKASLLTMRKMQVIWMSGIQMESIAVVARFDKDDTIATWHTCRAILASSRILTTANKSVATSNHTSSTPTQDDHCHQMSHTTHRLVNHTTRKLTLGSRLLHSRSMLRIHTCIKKCMPHHVYQHQHLFMANSQPWGVSVYQVVRVPKSYSAALEPALHNSTATASMVRKPATLPIRASTSSNNHTTWRLHQPLLSLALSSMSMHNT